MCAVSVDVYKTEERLRRLRAELTGIDRGKFLRKLDSLKDRERRLKI